MPVNPRYPPMRNFAGPTSSALPSGCCPATSCVGLWGRSGGGGGCCCCCASSDARTTHSAAHTTEKRRRTTVCSLVGERDVQEAAFALDLQRDRRARLQRLHQFAKTGERRRRAAVQAADDVLREQRHVGGRAGGSRDDDDPERITEAFRGRRDLRVDLDADDAELVDQVLD